MKRQTQKGRNLQRAYDATLVEKYRACINTLEKTRNATIKAQKAYEVAQEKEFAVGKLLREIQLELNRAVGSDRVNH